MDIRKSEVVHPVQKEVAQVHAGVVRKDRVEHSPPHPRYTAPRFLTGKHGGFQKVSRV